jgi:hypothetical protein
MKTKIRFNNLFFFLLVQKETHTHTHVVAYVGHVKVKQHRTVSHTWDTAGVRCVSSAVARPRENHQYSSCRTFTVERGQILCHHPEPISVRRGASHSTLRDLVSSNATGTPESHAQRRGHRRSRIVANVKTRHCVANQSTQSNDCVRHSARPTVRTSRTHAAPLLIPFKKKYPPTKQTNKK